MRFSIPILLAAVILSGCSAMRETVKKEPGYIKAGLMATVSRDGAGKVKKKCNVVMDRSSRFRFEIKGFFNEPLFLLLGNGDRLLFYFYQSNIYYEEQVPGSGASLNRLFNGTTGGSFEIKLKKTSYVFKLSYPGVSQENKLPDKIELLGEKIKIFLALQEPLFEAAIPVGTFEHIVPKNAININEEGLVRTIDAWIK